MRECFESCALVWSCRGNELKQTSACFECGTLDEVSAAQQHVAHVAGRDGPQWSGAKALGTRCLQRWACKVGPQWPARRAIQHTWLVEMTTREGHVQALHMLLAEEGWSSFSLQAPLHGTAEHC
eukprot:1158252-Pelagomonas_calceolata.AAC.2